MKSKLRFVVLFSILSGFGIYLLVYYGILMLGKPVSAPPPRQAAPVTERGSILDRNGRFLAIQLRFADVGIWRPHISAEQNGRPLDYNSSIDILTNEIAPILEMSSTEIRERITSSASDFLYIKRQIDDVTARRLISIMDEKKIKGIRIDPATGRLYPERNLASQIIGFVGDDNTGLEGIEFAFNSILDGDDINRGSHVVLAIDINVQHILEGIAARTMEETGAEAVMLLAMDPRNGDILGSASVPGFDPNNVRISSRESRMNRPVIWAYEPGSVFKVFSIAALQEAGAISSNTVFQCNGTYPLRQGNPISCLSPHGRVTAREIIIHSCNVGASYASENISNNAFYNMLYDFGFGVRTGAGSPGETAGYFIRSDQWSERSRPTIAFGQEIAVSAFQMVQAATAIANDGILVPPRIVLQTISADGKTVTDWEGGARRRILSAETARAMRSYMVDTTYGMGWRAAVEDISLAVKTGTAQIIDPVTNRYSPTDYIASCIALFPSESPSLVLYSAIIKPKGEIFGARIAAPAIREAAESLIDYLGIPRGRNPQIYHPPSVNIPAGRLPSIETQIPDFTGLAKRTLLPLMLRNDITVEIYGDGWVRRQSPAPGTPFVDGIKIILELE